MFRFETLAIGALLGSPVAALWLRGDFTDADVWWRFGLCWLAAWGAVTLVGTAARPLAGTTSDDTESSDESDGETADATDGEGPEQAEPAVGTAPAP